MSVFPKFTGPPRPDSKLMTLKRVEGKTIDSVEFGEQRMLAREHQSEAIVLHFTDGSAMAILVESNATNLSHQFKGLKPKDVSICLDLAWESPGK